MITERFIGGESQGRSLFGGKQNRPRTVGLGIVFVVGAISTMIFQGPALLLSGLAAGLVWVATMSTHFGSPWQRIQARRRWNEAKKSGRNRFIPVSRRPLALEEKWQSASRRQRKALAAEWAQYRDWPDGVEGMNWLQSTPGRPGIVWHTPTGQEAYFTVCFPVRGQVQGLEGDAAINAAASRFGRMLAGWSGETNLVSGIQALTRVLPVDSARHEQWVVDNVDWDTPERLLSSYDDVVRQVGRGGLMQRHYIVVRWPITSTFTQTAERRGKGEEGWRLLMEREVVAAQRRLQAARLQPGEALTAAQLSAVLRHLQMPSWPIEQASDVPVVWPWLSTKSAWSFMEVCDEGPDGEIETWFHRTARIPVETIGTGPRTPLWLLPFLTRLDQDVIRSVSFEIEAIPASEARAQARADLASDMADLYAQESKGSISNEELEVTKQAAQARRSDLKPGQGAAGAGFSMHVSLAARSEKELADACTVVEETLTTDLDIGEVKWLDPDQAAAAATCWPVARGMRPVARSRGDRITSLMAGKGRKEALT